MGRWYRSKTAIDSVMDRKAENVLRLGSSRKKRETETETERN